jgi:hypothetical protein
MFEFIKRFFRPKPATTKTDAETILVHTDINEAVVITEVAVADVKPKTRKPKAKEVTPVHVVTAVAKGVKPAAKKPAAKKTVAKAEPANIVQFVQPAPAKKKGRPKKDKV